MKNKNLKALKYFWTRENCLRGNFNTELYYKYLRARETKLN